MLDIASSVQAFTAHSAKFFSFDRKKIHQTIEPEAPTPNPASLRENGLLHGTMIATKDGWRTVEGITAGDEVMTFDNGLQRVVENQIIHIRRSTIPEEKAYLMFVPQGALGNRCDMMVLPMQEVIIESDQADELYGDPFVLFPMLMLDGVKGIHKTPLKTDLTLSMLAFQSEQVVHSNGGLLALANSQGCFSPLLATAGDTSGRYSRLTTGQLRSLIRAMTIPKLPHPAFTGQSIDETYAAIEARLR